MSIWFNEQEKIFHLQTQNSSYIFCVVEHDALEHLYYGKKIPNDNIKHISNRQIYAHHAHESRDSRVFSASTVGLEISPFNAGDIRTPSVVYDCDGKLDCNRLRYRAHKIYQGRTPLNGLPYSRENDEAESLEILLTDDEGRIEITLTYAYENQRHLCGYGSPAQAYGLLCLR